MNLKNFNNVSPNRIKRINEILKKQYGFTLEDSNLTISALEEAKNKIELEIKTLKHKGNVVNECPIISKKLIMLDGINLLHTKAKLDEMELQASTPQYVKVINWLAKFIASNVELGDDIADATTQAMKEYRSSQWRFPDEQVKSAAQQAAIQIITQKDLDMQLDEIEDLNKVLVTKPELKSNTPGKRAVFKIDDPFDAPPTDPWHSIDSSGRNRMSPIKKQEVKEPIPAKYATKASELSMLPKESIERIKKMREGHVRTLRSLLETEVGQAEVMIAAKGFSQDMQEMIERIGRLQNEDLPPLADQMADTYGTAAAEQFQNSTYASLQGVMDALTAARAQVNDAVRSMANGNEANIDMDLDVDVDPSFNGGTDAEIDADLDSALADIGDEFAGADPVIDDEPLGRAKMEQMRILANKLNEAKAMLKRVVAKQQKHK